MSILKNELYLKAYARDPRIDAPADVLELIASKDFWYKLQEMKRLLEPIHKWQKMSESTHTLLHYIYER